MVTYTSYIVVTEVFHDYLDDAKAAAILMFEHRSAISKAIDDLAAAVKEPSAAAGLAHVWDEHAGPLTKAVKSQADNATSAASDVLASVLLADSAAARGAEYLDGQVPEDILDGIAINQAAADARAPAADDWNSDWLTMADWERKGGA